MCSQPRHLQTVETGLGVRVSPVGRRGSSTTSYPPLSRARSRSEERDGFSTPVSSPTGPLCRLSGSRLSGSTVVSLFRNVSFVSPRGGVPRLRR